MKQRKRWAVPRKMAGLLTGGALLLAELAGVCFPVTVMADEGVEPLVFDEVYNENLISADSMAPDGIITDLYEEEVNDELTIDDVSEELDNDTNIFGNAPATKDQYYVTLTVKNNGKQRSWTKELEKGTQKALNEYGFYSSLMDEINAFINEDGSYKAILTGWSVYTDGFNVSGSFSTNAPVFLNEDACTYDKGYDYETYTPISEVFKLDGNKDYHFTANMAKSETGSLYISVIPSVYYNGRAHVAIGNKFNAKKEAADLRIKVFTGSVYDEYTDKLLEPGKDYTVSYSNNVNASMKLIRKGEEGKPGVYESLYSDNDPKRPKVTVTGKGDYKGFSGEAYFDIMPMNLGGIEILYYYLRQINEYEDTAVNNPKTYTQENYAQISGFGNSYLLKNGKVTGIPKQKVTKKFYTIGYDNSGKVSVKAADSVITLTEGRDYKAEIYKWNSSKSCWNDTGLDDPLKISEEGDYLYLVRGTGNYCGAVFGYYGSPNYGMGNADNFNTGENGAPAMPELNNDNVHQFRVTSEDSLDLSKARVSVKKKSFDYTGQKYGIDDFGISVTDKSGKKLEPGKDFSVYFRQKYSHYKNIDGVHNGSTVSAANEYTVEIRPLGDYFGLNSTAKVKITGIQFKPKYCGLTANQKKVPYGENNTWTLFSGRGIPNFVADGLNPAGTYGNDPMYVCGVVSTSEVYTAPKVDIYVAGSGRCGDAVDPSKGAVLTYTHTALKLQDTIKAGLLGFTFPEVYYNVKGAVPESLEIKVKGSTYTTLGSVYDPLYSGRKRKVYIDNVGETELAFTFKKNTKVNDTAILTVKASGVVTGSVNIEYKVNPKKIESIGSSYMHSLLITAPIGVLISGPVYSQSGKGDISKPQIALYQTYADAKGTKLAQIPSSMYRIEKSDTIGEKGIATKLKVLSAPGSPFDFGEGIELGDNYALYEKTLNANDIKQIKINMYIYNVDKGTINDPDFVNDGWTAFRGEQIAPLITSIILQDGTELKSNRDYRLEYGANMKVGKGSGTIMFHMNYNKNNDTFVYGGTPVIKFDITDAPGITL